MKNAKINFLCIYWTLKTKNKNICTGVDYTRGLKGFAYIMGTNIPGIQYPWQPHQIISGSVVDSPVV